MSWSTNLYLRWAATAAIALLALVIGVRWLSRERPPDAASLLVNVPDDAAPAQTLDNEPAETAQPLPDGVAGDAIAVDVIGAVAAPGVYRLAPAARVEDAITAAGGLAPDANRERINLAALLEDGAQIRVPRAGEVEAAAEAQQPAAGSAQTAAGGLVDLNTADVAALEELPGIGPATALAIVEYREANGPFAAVEDLQNVKGIGPSLLGQLAGLVTAGE